MGGEGIDGHGSAAWRPLKATPEHKALTGANGLPERALDTLRAFAVLCVLADHVIMSQIGETWALWVLGRLGVLLFFVHTSLVLTGSLERSGDTVARFYVRRAFRIYPLAIAAVALVSLFGMPRAVVPSGMSVIEPTLPILVSNLTLTTNLTGYPDVLGPLWSLPLEVQMYAMLPACFWVARRGLRPTFALMGAAIVAAIVVPRIPQLWRLTVLHFAPCFILGVLLFAYLRALSSPVRDLSASRMTRAAKQISLYSYGIYLLHEPALTVAFVWGRALPTALQWFVFAIVLVALSVTGFHAIEAPGIRIGKRLAGWRLRDVAVDPVP
jgi:peptidoglycan/LPS O-acetylase OafA/YrhL